MLGRFSRAFGFIVLCAVATGCSGADDVCVETEEVYSGSKAGTIIVIGRGPSGGDFLSAEPGVQGPFDRRDALSGSKTCSTALRADEPGWEVIAWLDVDDDEQEACAVLSNPPDPDCAPDATDPVVRRSFVMPASGTLLLQLELQDP
jgi:hypothetical protein